MIRMLWIGLTLAAMACANGAPHEPPAAAGLASADATGDRNKTIVAAYLDALNRGDTAGMAALMADDFVDYTSSVGGPATKQQTLDSVSQQVAANTYGPRRYTRTAAIAHTVTSDAEGLARGDWVFELGNLTTEPSRGSPNVGRPPTDATFHVAFRVTNGKIDTMTHYPSPRR